MADQLKHTCEHVEGNPDKMIPIQLACYPRRTPLRSGRNFYIKKAGYQVIRHEVPMGRCYPTLHELANDKNAPVLDVRHDFVLTPKGMRLHLSIVLPLILKSS